MHAPDPIGQAVHDYFHSRNNKIIRIHSDDFDTDTLKTAYFFRDYSQMPKLEQLALQKAKGTVLDIGACAGCHSIYLQQQGVDVTALEQSALCCEVLRGRGIEKVIQSDLFQFTGQQFDTLLLLMNGTGIAGTLQHFPAFVRHLKTLLKPNGQILMDSSDLIYLYLNDDGSADLDLNAIRYYGDLTYQAEYNRIKGDKFPWLYLDRDLLKKLLEAEQLTIESTDKGEHFDYLVTIKRA